MGIFLIIIISVLVTLGIVTLVKQSLGQKKTNEQSIILLDKIKRVCKFITVEGYCRDILLRRC